MSVVVGVRKENKICIASDSQASLGPLKVSQKHLVNFQKILKVNDSYIGLVGWRATIQIIEHLITTKPDIFDLSSHLKIFESTLSIQSILKDKYFIETEEEDDQPVESSQISAIIINKNGLFEIESYREIREFEDYWAIGSGDMLALGAMYALYHKDYSASAIAEEAVQAACEYDEGCGLPVILETIKL